MNHIISNLKYYPPFCLGLFYKTYRQWYHFLKQSEHWNKERIKSYQLEQLNTVLKYVDHHNPYYHHLFETINLKTHHLEQLSDLKKIPILSKDLIRKNVKKIKSTQYPSIAFRQTQTGGTTGQPLIFYVEKARWMGKHFAFNRNYMEQIGYRPHHKVLSISGKTKKIQHHPLLRTLEFSSLQISQKNALLYAKETLSFNPDYISSYPSALFLFTRYLRRTNKNIPKIKGIFCHGETLFDWQRAMFEETYHCPVLDQYGHREQAVFATTCPESNLYHVYPQYGILELIHKKDTIQSYQKEYGEIIATSLHKTIFPFIRYHTEDLGEQTEQKCGCGRAYPLIKKIKGRSQDYLITKNNDIIPLTGTYHLIAESSTHITECQLYQEKEGELILFIVIDDCFTDTEMHQLKSMIDGKIGSLFTINIKQVDHIPRTKHGKYRYLIQKIPIHPR